MIRHYHLYYYFLFLFIPRGILNLQIYYCLFVRICKSYYLLDKHFHITLHVTVHFTRSLIWLLKSVKVCKKNLNVRSGFKRIFHILPRHSPRDVAMRDCQAKTLNIENFLLNVYKIVFFYALPIYFLCLLCQSILSVIIISLYICIIQKF